MKPTIGIVGCGFVGNAVSQLSEVFSVVAYDPYKKELSNNIEAFSQDVVFVCVPTPRSDDGSLDTSIVESSAKKWVEMKKDNSVLVIKSTIPMGTVEKLSDLTNSRQIVHNPEFLTERTAMEDFRNPQEVIIGGDSSAAELVSAMYKEYYGKKDIQYFNVSARTAEMIKMTRNSFYALKVSFFNEIYELCEAMGEDYNDFKKVFTLNGKHPWIGNEHISVPGPDGKLGFGGKCLPKDSEGLLKIAEEYGIMIETLKAAVKANKNRREL